MLPYLLVAAAALIGWRGVTKLDLRARTPAPRPWGALLLWATLFGGSVLVWLIYPPH